MKDITHTINKFYRPSLFQLVSHIYSVVLETMTSEEFVIYLNDYSDIENRMGPVDW